MNHTKIYTMKRFFASLFTALLFAAGCSDSNSATDDPGGPDEPQTAPRVTTAAAREIDARSALLGGSVADAELSDLTAVGIQYVTASDAAMVDQADWSAGVTVQAEIAAAWSVRIVDLAEETTYRARAFVRTAATAYYGDAVTFTTGAISLAEPVVTTEDVTEFDDTSALLGGCVTDVTSDALDETGVQYTLWNDAAAIDNLDWTQAEELTTEPDTQWSVQATGLTEKTQYAVRAFAGIEGRRYFGRVKSFTTSDAIHREPLTVARLRDMYAAAEDVSAHCVRGYVALSMADDIPTESFAAGTVILYDNTGVPGSALMFCGSASDPGIGAAGLQEGDYVELSLAGAERDLAWEPIPVYAHISRDDVRIIGRGHAIDPVWVTPAELVAGAAEYAWSPVRVSRIYAEKPGMPFSYPENFFTDGQTRFAVYAAPGSTVGQLTQNAATGTLYGICSYDGEVRVVPVKISDVAAFTGDDGIAEGEPAIEIRNTNRYEFSPQGGTRVVDLHVTAGPGMRLWADVRNIDPSRYAVDIVGSRVYLTARANTTGVASDYANCYIYLAETKDGQRYVPQTLSLAQLGNRYESIPALIRANGGEWASVHEAVVNGVQTEAMKIGTGSSTGHYTSDPTGAAGDRTLTFYAVGWKEGDHEAGTLYLRVQGGGEASQSAIPLRIDEGATGQAPFVLNVDDESRYEVTLRGLQPGSVIEFSTSPAFDKRPDKKTGRALLFGVQID